MRPHFGRCSDDLECSDPIDREGVRSVGVGRCATISLLLLFLGVVVPGVTMDWWDLVLESTIGDTRRDGLEKVVGRSLGGGGIRIVVVVGVTGPAFLSSSEDSFFWRRGDDEDAAVAATADSFPSPPLAPARAETTGSARSWSDDLGLVLVVFVLLRFGESWRFSFFLRLGFSFFTLGFCRAGRTPSAAVSGSMTAAVEVVGVLVVVIGGGVVALGEETLVASSSDFSILGERLRLVRWGLGDRGFLFFLDLVIGVVMLASLLFVLMLLVLFLLLLVVPATG